MKKNNGITKKTGQLLSDYYKYENIVFRKKDDLIKDLNLLRISSSIRNLLEANLITCVIKNQIYKVRRDEGELNALLEIMFSDPNSFYIGGVLVYNHYGFIEQLPQLYQVINTSISGQRKICNWNMLFRKRKPEFQFGINIDTHFPLLERIMLDFCQEFGYARFLTIWNNKKELVDISKLIEFSLKYPINATARRVLFTVNKEFPIKPEIRKLVVTKAIIPLFSTPNLKGKQDSEWNIIINGER